MMAYQVMEQGSQLSCLASSSGTEDDLPELVLAAGGVLGELVGGKNSSLPGVFGE